MKRLFVAIVMSLPAVATVAQIKNAGFEIPGDTIASLPRDWGIIKKEGFVFSLDSAIKHDEASSFSIKTVQQIDPGTFGSFSQAVSVTIHSVLRLAVTAYIKTKEIRGSGGLWCQVRDRNDKMIGFQSLAMRDTMLNGTNEWKKYSLLLMVDTNCKKLYLGGYLSGMGAIWYDDFAVQELTSAKPASKEVKKYINGLCKIIRNNSIYSDSLDWKAINENIQQLSKGITSISDARVLSEYVMNKLSEKGDNHSSIISKNLEEEATRQNLATGEPTAKVLKQRIGYLSIPAFESVNDTVSLNFSAKIQTLIKKLDSANVITGWIVDLRQNTGGNMYPMIAGLGPLLNADTLGYFVSARGKVTTFWYYKDGICGSGKHAEVKIKQPYFLRNKNSKIAVLLGNNTASSGEMTTISFIGQPGVKLFGQPSGGYTTANAGFMLTDSSYIYLAAAYTSDRNHKKYIKSIIPDVVVNDNEQVMGTAIQWLDEK